MELEDSPIISAIQMIIACLDEESNILSLINEDSIIDDNAFADSTGLLMLLNKESDDSDSFWNSILKIAPDEFRNCFKMTKSTFQVIFEKISSKMFFHDKSVTRIPPDRKLLSALWYFCHLETFTRVAQHFKVSRSVVHSSVLDVIEALNQIADEVIVWPDAKMCEEYSKDFEMETGMSGIIGIIGTTEIPCKTPVEAKCDFLSKEGYSAIVLQAVCNTKMEFIHIYIEVNGNFPKLQVLKSSPIKDILEVPSQHIPSGYHILGDGEYPCSGNLISPFLDNGFLSMDEQIFNRTHKSACSVLQKAFLVLNYNFHRLRFIDINKFQMIPSVIVACCVLHNLIIRNESIVEGEMLKKSPRIFVTKEKDVNYAESSRKMLMKKLIK